MKLLKFPDPKLRIKSRPVTPDDDITELIAEMKSHIGFGALGIAAPQLGVHLRVIVLAEALPSSNSRVLINPKATIHLGATISGPSIYTIKHFGQYYLGRSSHEGCLSLPGVFGEVLRWKKIELTFTGENGVECISVIGQHACVIQHEIDHLNGVLFIDHSEEAMTQLTSLIRRGGWDREDTSDAIDYPEDTIASVPQALTSNVAEELQTAMYIQSIPQPEASIDNTCIGDEYRADRIDAERVFSVARAVNFIESQLVSASTTPVCRITNNT